MLTFLKKLFGGTPVNYKELISNGAIIADVRSVFIIPDQRSSIKKSCLFLYILLVVVVAGNWIQC